MEIMFSILVALTYLWNLHAVATVVESPYESVWLRVGLEVTRNIDLLMTSGPVICGLITLTHRGIWIVSERREYEYSDWVLVILCLLAKLKLRGH